MLPRVTARRWNHWLGRSGRSPVGLLLGENSGLSCHCTYLLRFPRSSRVHLWPIMYLPCISFVHLQRYFSLQVSHVTNSLFTPVGLRVVSR
jgi:hypothetical protein